MDFLLDDDERELASNVRGLCERTFPIGRLRQLSGSVDRRDWRALGDAGVFGLRLGEEAGGTGLGMVHAALVFEELGRALVPGPLTASHLAAGLVDGAASGESVVGLVNLGPEPREPLLVEYLSDLDVLLVVDEGGLWHADLDELGAEAAAHPLDPLTPVHRVTGLLGQGRGTRIAGPEEAARWRLEGALLSSSLLVGVAGALTDAAVDYAKEREQFGRPIGSFQAVKHMLADMLVRAEVARSAMHAAAVTFDDPEVGDLARAVAGAKLLAGQAAISNGKACIQVHGGMGFTWEVDAHLYLKRALVLDTWFGSADEQAEAVVAGV